MVINTNVPSAFASRVLSASTQNLSKSLAKLSSGTRIVSPDDDAAGLAVGMKFSAELKRIGGARANVGNAIAFSSTQDGYMSKVDSALRRMSELATLAADQTKADSDVANYQKEFAELKSFITASSSKSFNSIGLFSATTLADVELGTLDALIKTQYDAVTTTNTAWVADPARIANAGTTVTSTAATDDVFTASAHGMTTGEKVTYTSQTSGAGPSVGTTYYVKKLDANTFELYTSAAMTSKVDVTTAVVAGVLTRSGEYDLLQDLREDMAEMAREWYQKERGTDTTKVQYGTDTTKTWGDVYDFWSSRTGTTWSGVRAHTDTYTTSLAPNHEIHVGNASALSDSLIEGYKKMVADVQSYVNNRGAGITVTDSSDATTFQLKGADLTTITNAIANSTDTNALTSDLAKTNASTYVSRVSTLINNLAGSRAYVGANISRLSMVDSQLAVYGENLSAANSRVMDVDVATESAEYAKQQILVQSGTAMLAQSNILPQSALRLLAQ